MALRGCDGPKDLLAFREALRWGDGLAKNTMLCVHYELSSWTRWLESRNKCWREVTPDDLRTWLAVATSRQAAKTVDKRAWVLRRLYRWAQSEGILASDPWEAITRPARNVPWQPRYSPSESSVLRLLKQPDTTTMTGIRDRAILELLYATGLRAMELVTLQAFQVNCGVQDRSIRVMGKGGRERIVIYGEHASIWLRYYAGVARRELLGGGRQTGQFFVNDTDSGTFTYPVLRYMIKRYAVAAGEALLTAHSLRHAFATHLYQNGVNLRVIQLLLGHSQLVTTTVYAHTSTAQLLELIEHHHPRGAHYGPSRERFRAREAVGAVGTDKVIDNPPMSRPQFSPLNRWPPTVKESS